MQKRLQHELGEAVLKNNGELSDELLSQNKYLEHVIYGISKNRKKIMISN